MSQAATPAATLILIRERAGQALELLIVQRSAGMAAFGGALVFPGGRIDDADERLGKDFDDPLAGARIAAIRETLEETAVPAGITPVPSPEIARQMQAEIHAGKDFGLVLTERQLALELAQLTQFARWHTPPLWKRRFDTHFFIARAPAGDWQPRAQEDECVSASWLTAADLVRRSDEGSGELLFVTRCNVERVGQHSTYAQVLEDAARHSVETIHPKVIERDGLYWSSIDPRHGYPVTDGQMSSPQVGGTQP